MKCSPGSGQVVSKELCVSERRRWEDGAWRIEGAAPNRLMARSFSNRYMVRIVTDLLVYVGKGSVSFNIASF